MDPNTSIGRLCLGENNQAYVAEGEFYFVKFIINPEDDDVEKSVILGRSFMRLTKGIANFGNRVITLLPELDPFLDNSEKTKKFKDDWDNLLDIDFGDIPEIDEAGLPPFICKMGKSKRNKKRALENFQLFYSNVGPLLFNGKPLTQEEAAREALAINICKIFSILEEERPLIETMAYSVKYKKILDGIVMDKLKLDGKIKKKEEEAIKQVKGEALKEKEDPGAFIIPIRLEAKIDLNALADIGSDINVMPYRIYAKLGREEVKKVNRGITMLNHSKAEPMGVLKDVLCQVGVTTIIAKFLILDMPIDRDAPILVGRGFLYTCGSILNTRDRITSTFDGVCHQTFRVAKTSLNIEESDSDDEENYGIQRNNFGAPMYGPKPAKYLNCNDLIDRALALQEVLNPFRKICVWKKAVGFLGSLPSIGTHDDEAGSSSSRPKRARITKNVEEALMGRVLHELLLWGNCNLTLKNMYNTNLAGNLSKQIYSPFIVDWNVLNTLGCGNAIEDMLEVRVNEMGSDEVLFTSEAWKRTFDINEPIYTELCHEFYATFEFDEAVADDELMTKKVIKFRLCGKDYAMSILDFAKRLGLYTDAEIQEYGFETYFIRGLRNDDDFSVDQYWLTIGSEETLTLSRSSAKTIRKLVLRVLQKMITCGLCQRTTGYDKVQKNELWIAKRLGILSDEVLNGLSAPTYCRTLDAKILRELIGSNGRLIPEDIAHSILRVATPRAQCPTTSDLYDKISQLETRIGEIERMTRRQSYYSDRYARVLKHISSHFEVTPRDPYDPPSYFEQQQQDDEDKTLTNQIIEGIKEVVSENQFAFFLDDLFIFARRDVESARVIMDSLEEFKKTSGLVLSTPKSTTYFCNVLYHIKLAILNIMPYSEDLSSLLNHLCNNHHFSSSCNLLPSYDLVTVDQHAHTLCHFESCLTISLDNLCLDDLDTFKEDVEYQSSGRSHKSPTVVLFDVDTGRISIRHCEMLKSTTLNVLNKDENADKLRRRVPLGSNFQNPNPDLRPMEELLQAPTDGVGDGIVVPPILANHLELKIGLLNLVTTIAFHGFENDDPHSHIR
ncbi:ribonuclease H-like domain-containing protein [Tanacetum coccineum]